MKKRYILGGGGVAVVFVLLVVAGVTGVPDAPEQRAAPGEAQQRTAPAPAAQTATPVPDYRGLANSLREPLSALIVATRNKSPNAPAWQARFNEAAGRVLPVIERDMSTQANVLHSAIRNVQEAAPRGDIAVLDAERRRLLEVR